jgi:hypothetical protein
VLSRGALLAGCGAVRLTWALLIASGCYLSHERDRAVEVGGRDDGGPGSFDAGGAGDAPVGTGPDAGTVPPPRCALTFTRERLIAIDSGGSMTAPDLFWTGDRVGVVFFHSDTDAHPVVDLSHVDLDLREVGTVRVVGEEAHGWGEGAWTGDAVGVCWNGDPGGRSALRFREVSGVDGSLGPRTDFDSQDGPCLDLAYAHGRYAMTWRFQHGETGEVVVDTVAQLIERDGTRVGPRIELASAPYPGMTSSIVAHPAGFVYVVATGDAIRVVRVDAGGAVRGDRTLPAPGASYAHADLRDGQLGILWFRGPVETRSLVFTLLDAELSPMSERVIEDGTPTVAYPRVLARPEGWVLVWGQGSRPTVRAMVLSLDRDGVPIAPRAVLHEGDNSSYGGPSLLSVDESVFVGLSHPQPETPGGREGLYVQRWDCVAEAADPCRTEDAQAGDCAGDHLWGFRWTGSGCEPVIGCASDCIGADCDRLAATRFACESDRRECMPAECPASGAAPEDACGPIEVAANRSSTLTLAITRDACHCIPSPTCRARASGPAELTLELVSCEVITPDCECAPGPTRRDDLLCVLPPMQPGTWTVRTPGGVPFELLVRPPWETPSEEHLCRHLGGG